MHTQNAIHFACQQQLFVLDINLANKCGDIKLKFELDKLKCKMHIFTDCKTQNVTNIQACPLS